MSIKEKDLQTVNTIEDDDKVRIVTSGGDSRNIGYEDLLNNIEDGIDSKGGATNISNGTNGALKGLGAAAEGDNYTMGTLATAFGNGTKASGMFSHAEGANTTASGYGSHAEGAGTTASGYGSHAEGANTTASAPYSHAEGANTTASGEAQHVMGRFNAEDANGTYVFIIGNGGSDDLRKNAFAIKWDGTFVFANGTEITPAQFADIKALLNS